MKEPDLHEFREAVHEYGAIQCEGCGGTAIDLSDAETVNEAIEIWKEHIRDVHEGNE